ncbi:B12-binding domain-containing radical SAM protein [Candidatus Synechococcus calcipolaris G9]|uniref:B12-binding domain-containing radical SAM protein n=1 Tax=Candidatus Synechococcus calcipolaris G9 TaxID=1497997 RepID=A0ABT6F0E2_9SYNE|nr:radical SAM protein [Candidatus Synechococcus calcipolaris]MDG2991291.1 B12-binding domain-containing radical SAM protein [Candidatus Synechococcus calcipolaris G9]
MNAAALFQAETHLFTIARPQPDALKIIYGFPNTYSVGITSLGYQVVWAMLAQDPGVDVRRLFTDVRESLPRNPDLLGFSLSWELDYGNILTLLEQLKLPLWARERQGEHPLVFGGGPVLTANPEPYADFFDVILLGDGEDLLQNFLEAYRSVRGTGRQTQLDSLAQVPGLYVPSLYQVSYQENTGAIARIEAIKPTIPDHIIKQTYRGNTLATSTVVTPHAAWENIYMVEVVRSCPEMCRFCLASYLTLPFRSSSLESLIPAIARGLTVTHRIGLLGASVSQHPEFEALLDYLGQPQFAEMRLSLASVRTNTVTPKLTTLLTQRGTKSLTIAIETGSERLRQVINKKLDTQEIFQAAANARSGGLKGLKFYGMVGIPGETDGDVQATVDLFRALKKQVPGLRLTLGCSTFVPKAHTPFQWLGVRAIAEKRLKFLKKELGRLGIDFRPEPYGDSLIQALLSRGDRRLGPLLERVRCYGQSLGSYRRTFKEFKGKLPTMEHYVHSDWPTGGQLPWDHLQGPLSNATLTKHLELAQENTHDI